MQQETCDYVIKKTRYSAFIRTDLKKLLNELSVNELIITGFQLGACINTTVNKYLQLYRDVKNLKSTSEILSMLSDRSLKSLCQDYMN